MIFGASMDYGGVALIVGQPGCQNCVSGQAYPADATVFVSSTPDNWAAGAISSRNLRSQIAGDGEMGEHHISLKEEILLIKAAKEKGIKVTC